MNDKYTIVILCGKAGAGKDYLLQKVKNHYGDKLNYVISDTTRPMRFKETQGVEYNFLSSFDFFTSEHLETTCYETDQGAWYYGTPPSALDENKINIAILNISGINQLYERDNLDIHVFYVSANDKDRLLRQMNREEYPNYLEICRRYITDEKDFKNLKFPFIKLRNSPGVPDDQCADILFEEIDNLLVKSSSDRIN